MTISLSFKHSMTFNNNYWMRCSIAILFFFTIIQKKILLVQSNPTGASNCLAGTASVVPGSPHSTAAGGISAAGVTLLFGDQPVPDGAGLTLQPGTYSITLNGPFLGILIRLSPVDGVTDTSNALTVTDTTNFRVLDLCTIPTTGVTHNNKDQKTTATFGLDTTRLADKIVTMEITMVTLVSSYYFNTYTLNNTQAVVPTTAAPVVAPVTSAPVLAPVTPAPLAAPITPAPLAAPITPAPVVPGVPVTTAPVVPGVPTRAPSVRAPVAASVRIPVQSEFRTNARQPHRNPTTTNRNNNNNNNNNNNRNNNRSNNNNNYKDTNIAAAALVSDQTYTLDTPTTAPIKTTTISQKGLMQYLANFW